MHSSFTRRSLISLIEEAVERHSDLAALSTPARGDECAQRLSFREMWRETALLADGLRKLGLKRGENVLILSENRDRWLLCDLALQGLGCPDVPRGTEAPAEEIAHIVEKVRSRVAFVEHSRFLERLPRGATAPELVVLLSGEMPNGAFAFRLYSFAQVQELADLDQALERFHADVAERRAEDVATIVFTSGTTGHPKGVVLTSANLAGNLLQAAAVISHLPRGGRGVSILPPWHTFERMVEYALLHLGLSIVYSSRRLFAEDLRDNAPHVLAAVPRIWMLLMDGVLGKIRAGPPLRRAMLGGALRLAALHKDATRAFRGRSNSVNAGEAGGSSRLNKWSRMSMGLAATPLVVLLRVTLIRRIREALGVQNLDRRGAAISGGGSLPSHVDRFFEALGVPLLNGYGLTETSPVLTIRQWSGSPITGSVGRPLEQTEIRIVDQDSGRSLPAGSQGLIFVRGPQVMQGYHEDSEATHAVLTRDGWLNTGDLGILGPEGELTITGRAKDTIVLLSGENIEPEPLENALASSPLIKQAVVVGQDQKYLGALIFLNEDTLRSHGVETRAVDSDELYRQIRTEIDRKVNPRQGFRSHERIVRFQVLPAQLSVEDGSLSQTLKVKRNVVHARHAALIRGLFDEAAKS